MSDVDVLYHDDTYVLATAGRLMVTCYWDAPNVHQIEKITEFGVPWDAAHDNKTAFAQFIVDGTPRFSTEVRDAAAAIGKSRIFRLGTANVVEVGGLRGSATRAFLSTVTLLSGKKYRSRNKVYADPSEAATWLAEILDAADPGAWSTERVEAVREVVLGGRG